MLPHLVRQFDPDQQPPPPHLPDATELLGECPEPGEYARAQGRRVVGEAVLPHVSEGRGARRHGELIARGGVARAVAHVDVVAVDHDGQRQTAPGGRGQHHRVGRAAAVLHGPEGTGAPEPRQGLVGDHRARRTRTARRARLTRRACARRRERPATRTLPSAPEERVGELQDVAATGRRAHRVERGRPGVSGGRSAEPHARTAGEPGREGPGQLGDEGVPDRGRHVGDVQRCARVDDPAHRLEHHGVVVAEGEGARAGEAVQVTAAVRALDGHPPRSHGDDRQHPGLRPAIRRFRHRPASSTARAAPRAGGLRAVRGPPPFPTPGRRRGYGSLRDPRAHGRRRPTHRTPPQIG